MKVVFCSLVKLQKTSTTHNSIPEQLLHLISKRTLYLVIRPWKDLLSIIRLQKNLHFSESYPLTFTSSLFRKSGFPHHRESQSLGDEIEPPPPTWGQVWVPPPTCISPYSTRGQVWAPFSPMGPSQSSLLPLPQGAKSVPSPPTWGQIRAFISYNPSKYSWYILVANLYLKSVILDWKWLIDTFCMLLFKLLKS